jgi:hypothetical protein
VDHGAARVRVLSRVFRGNSWLDCGHCTRLADSVSTGARRRYPYAIEQLKRSGELAQRCRYRRAPYLNNILEMVFTQMTKTKPSRCSDGGDYIADLDFALGHKDPVNYQFPDRALLVKRCIDQTGVNSAAEILDR